MKQFVGGIIFIVIVLAVLSILISPNDSKITGSFIGVENLLLDEGQIQANEEIEVDLLPQLQSSSEKNLVVEQVLDDQTPAGEILQETLIENTEKFTTLNRIRSMIFKPKFNPDIVDAILDLRIYTKEKDKVKIATQIKEINEFIESRDSVLSSDPWQKILDCSYDECEEELYLRLIDSIVLEDNEQRSNLIHYIIQSAIFWNTKNTVFFSETLTNANFLIEDFDNDLILEQWTSIIECNAQCPEFHDKIFRIIETISEAKVE